MADLVETASWDAGIYQLEQNDPVLGGPPDLAQEQGFDNVPHQMLANRTLWLKGQIEELASSVDAVDILAKLITVDGHLSGLDADTLDGRSSGDFAKSSHEIIAGTGLTGGGTLYSSRTITADIATESEALLGTSNVKLMTPLRVKYLIDALNDVIDTKLDISQVSPWANWDAEGELDKFSTRRVIKDYISSQIPTGMIWPYAAQTPPSGWLECDGSNLPRSTYSNLFDVIGETYNAVGTNSSRFNIPDLRGEFVRGWDNGRGADPARVLGSFQQGSHITGDDGVSAAVHGIARLNLAEYDLPDGVDRYVYYAHTSTQLLTASSNHWGRVRPRNVSLMYCIKY